MLAAIDELCRSLEPGQFICAMTLYLEHGLLTAEDKDSSARYDELMDDAEGIVRAQADSVCIATQIYVDGPVSVVVLRNASITNVGSVVFDGIIAIPSGCLRVEDSDKLGRMLVQVPAKEAVLTISVDDPVSVGCVVISVRDARSR